MTITRRALLISAATGAATLTACSAGSDTPAPRSSGATESGATPSGTSPVHHAYGSDPSQFGELSRPAAASKPGTIVIIHGGFWQSAYDLSLGRPLAADLVTRGYTVWNLEYRRIGDGGGWPQTFDDVAAGNDKLADLDVDTSHVVAIGHSAGGQLAVWAAGRPKQPHGDPGAQPKVRLTAVVSQAGVLDLITASDDGVGGDSVAQLMGGTPTQEPDRYRIGDPIEMLPILAPVLCVHSHADQNVPFAQSTAYVAAAHKLGSQATLDVVQGDHFTLIDPTSAAWHTVVDALPGLLRH